MIQIIYFHLSVEAGAKKMANNSGKSKPKTSPPPTPPTKPGFRCEVVGKHFKIGGKLCQLLRAIGPKDGKRISTATMIKRGSETGIWANMSAEDAQFFKAHRGEIPNGFEGYNIIFPEAKEADGRIKYLERGLGAERFMLIVPAETDWDNGDLIARLVDRDSQLLINTSLSITQNA